MILRLLNLALNAALAPFIYCFSYHGYKLLTSVFTLDSTPWFLGGTALSLLIHVLLLNNHNLRFVQDLLHEMEHAAVAFLLSFQLPKRMEIDPEKGSKVVLVPARGGCMMTLAPYYLLLLTVPFLIVKAVAFHVFPMLNVPFPPLLAVILDLLIGATLMFHLLSSIKEFRTFQTDFKRRKSELARQGERLHRRLQTYLRHVRDGRCVSSDFCLNPRLPLEEQPGTGG